MKKNALAIITVLIMILGSSCASVISKSSYPVFISSSPSESKVTITNRGGHEIYTGKTPCSLVLDAGSGYFRRELYKVKFEKEGYDTKTKKIFVKVDGWYYGNLILGGFVGLLIVDPATGAMYKIANPYVSGTLTKSTSSHHQGELQIFDINEIPEEWKEHLVLIQPKSPLN